MHAAEEEPKRELDPMLCLRGAVHMRRLSKFNCPFRTFHSDLRTEVKVGRGMSSLYLLRFRTPHRHGMKANCTASQVHLCRPEVRTSFKPADIFVLLVVSDDHLFSIVSELFLSGYVRDRAGDQPPVPLKL